MAGNSNSGGSGKKSVAELKLSGTYREVRHGSIEVPEDARAKPKPEQHITSRKIPKKADVYKRFANVIHNQNLSTEDDGIIISQLTELYVGWCLCSELLELDGVEARIGNKLAINLMVELAKEIRIIMGEFHLTPTTRRKAAMDMKATTSKTKVDDPVANFISVGKPTLVK